MSGFVYTIECIDKDGNVKWTEEAHNIIPTEAQNYFITAAITGGTRYTAWYIGIYENNYAPVVGDTMATFAASAGEITAYSEVARPSFTPGSVSGGLITNYDDPAEFTFTSDKTVRGGFIVSSSTKGGTTGLLLSPALFASARSVLTGEGLRVKAGMQLASS
jgi:hypothetical protein